MQNSNSSKSHLKSRYQPEYSVLLVDKDAECVEQINRAFAEQTQCRLTHTSSLKKARSIIDRSNPDLIITDASLPDGYGTDLINTNSTCPTIVLNHSSDEKIAVSAIKSGAADYVVKNQQGIASLPGIAGRVMREWRLLLDQKLANERQQRLVTILEATPDLICIADLDGFLTYINQAGRNLLGITKSEEVSRIRLADFHSPADGRKILSEGIPCAIREGMWTDETTFLALNGDNVLTSQVLISHRDHQGEIEFFSTIARDIRHLRAAEEQVEYLAYYDSLTGLPNRNEMVKRLDIEIARVNRSNLHGALLFIDLDNFKNINDSLGHPAGDRVLQEMAHRLKLQLRIDDTVARLGGDEFVVILSSLSHKPAEAVLQAREIANKISEVIAIEFKLLDTDLTITASIGISMIVSNEIGGHDLLRFADTAMYQAKRDGRNRVEFFSQSMSSDVNRQLTLENELRRALRERQFRLHFQPLVNNAQQIIGVETLIRWQHPQKGLVSPAEFLDVLESSGQIIEVGDWVIETAFKQISLWLQQGFWKPDFQLCINISPRQFLDENFSQNFYQHLENINPPAENIILEVTEHNTIPNLDLAISRMQELIQRGISFSLDDFGTGYSSLSHLKNLPVSHIKIDRSFVKDICQCRGDQAMVQSILAMARHLGLEAVAEGVEHREQFELLQSYDCQYYQGYYFSEPLSSKDMLDYLKSNRT